jgi:hypothetical protein
MVLVNITASVARTKGFAAQEVPCSGDVCERRLDIDGVGLEKTITLLYVVGADVRYGGESDSSGSV